MRSEIIKFLLQSQNPDGGWGYFPGKSSALEATAFALLAVRLLTEAATCKQKAISFLKSRQAGTGGWPVNTSESEAASWVSSLAGHALFEAEGYGNPVRRSAEYLESTFGKVPLNWWTRLSIAMGNKKGLPFDVRFGGWNWNPSTTPWVEPTSYALLFLKKIGTSLLPAQLQGFILEAETMLYDRMCPSGGWNYGNSRVLGEDLRPYLLTTAIALMALQDHPEREENRRSLEYLQRTLSAEKSALSLAYAILCLDLYRFQDSLASDSLLRIWEEDHFFKNTKTAALASLALDARERGNPFRLAPASRRV